MNILLVEDNPADARLIEIYLKESPLTITDFSVANSMHAGLEILSKREFDMILLDLSLPDSMGIDTFKTIHESAGESPIIVLTGLEDETVGINTVKLGAQDFLIKGKLDSKILARSINYSIERSKLLKSLAETAKTLAEKTSDLTREKQKLAQAQKLAHIGSWEWDIKENLFNCSEEMMIILGLKHDQQIESFQDFLDFLHPEDRTYAINIVNQAITEKKPFEFIHRMISNEGIIKTLLAKGELMLNKDEEVIKVIGTKQDITKRMREEQFEKIAMAVIKSYNAVTIADKEGKIEWVNEGFTKLFGYKIDEVHGTYGEILRRGDNTGLFPGGKYYKTLFQEKKPVSYENKNYAKNGTEYWVLTSLTPLLNEQGEIEKIVSIDSNITKQKIAEQELIVANKIAEHSLYKGEKALQELHKAKAELEDSLKVKEQFIANMSHEIRTPMNAIIGFTNLLLKGNFSEDNAQYIKAIKTSGENLLVIINDILDFSKLKSGKIVLEHTEFNLQELVSTIIDLMLPKAVEKEITLSSSIDKNIKGQLIGDPTRLNQILINLVGNAIKFTDHGGVKLSVSMLSETEDDQELQFCIDDTGIGIAMESLEKIFEGFTQATSDTTRKYGGTGLGLTITKQLVEMQGGSIWVSSKINQGSSFLVNLTFKKACQSEDKMLYKPDGFKDKKFLHQIKVLLVEDNYFNQTLAAKILENWNCHVDLAENGLVATEKAAMNKYDIILMDIQLPEMDGYQATEYIRTKLPSPQNAVPIIAMTAHAFLEEIEKCFKYGMNDYISKPFDEKKLFEKIFRMVNQGK